MNDFSSQNLTGRRVLIVDDKPDNLQVLAKTLESENLKIFMAQGGQQALDQISQVRPDLILLDVMMPEMDGFEACRILKSDEQTRHIPVIFLTALDHPNDIE